jgi:hypothetical protein
VQRWQLLTGADEDDLSPAGEPVAWEDLETEIPVDASSGWVAVRALGGDGKVLGQSRPQPVPAA